MQYKFTLFSKPSLAAAILAVATFSAQAITLNATADTTISRHSNMGGGVVPQGSWASMMIIGLPGYETSALIKFDTSMLLGQVATSDATVSLAYEDVNYTSAVTFNVFALNTPWTEEAATWNNFTYGTGPLLATQSAASGQAEGTSVQFTLPKAQLQTWLDTPLSNNGIILVASSNQQRDFRFSSRESGDQWAPKLTFSVQEVPEPATWLLFAAGLAALVCSSRLARNRSGVPAFGI